MYIFRGITGGIVSYRHHLAIVSGFSGVMLPAMPGPVSKQTAQFTLFYLWKHNSIIYSVSRLISGKKVERIYRRQIQQFTAITASPGKIKIQIFCPRTFGRHKREQQFLIVNSYSD